MIFIIIITTCQKTKRKRTKKIKYGMISVQRYKKKLLTSVPKESLVENGILVQEYKYKKNRVCIKDYNLI